MDSKVKNGVTKIIVDWGTSSFRAYRFNKDGKIVDRHRVDAGILTVKDGAFEEALEREIGSWISQKSEILLSGMITSRNGWVETPYASIPTTIEALAEHSVTRHSKRGATLKFLPGVATDSPLADVMRGEEIQIFGVVNGDEKATVVLPGTHSKWAQVEDGAILGFRTFLTGEMFAILKNHSILGRLIPRGDPEFNQHAFLAGVNTARSTNSISLLNDVFTARSGALLGNFSNNEIEDRLSGILIGHEINAGLTLHHKGKIVLVGETHLTNLYSLAFRQFGLEVEIAPVDAAVEGFRRLSALKKTS